MHDFTGQKMPRVPSWNATQTGTVPSAIADMVSFNASTAASGSACCADEWLSERQDFGWRNRSAACVDLDDLIGAVFDGFEKRGVLDNTFVFFELYNEPHRVALDAWIHGSAAGGTAVRSGSVRATRSTPR